MIPSGRSNHDRSSVRQRVLTLSQRWLPMLLARVGVPKLEAEKLRTLSDAEQLERDLEEARAAVELRARARGEQHELVGDAREAISSLRRALQLAKHDPRSAHVLVDEVDRRWLQLVVFGKQDRAHASGSAERADTLGWEPSPHLAQVH